MRRRSIEFDQLVHIDSRSVRIMKVQWGEVDGVPTLSADAGQVPGPLHACLMFGTGRSDETLRASGINHIIEHLVLHSLGATPYSWNGEVNAVSTLFWAQGGPAQIVEFFELVVRGLNELPMERLAEELRVLEIESQRRGISQVGFDLTTRFGPKGAGLFGWLEQGLHCLDAETIVEWARTRFTTNNAVLWLSGPIPEQLQLREPADGRVGRTTATPTAARSGARCMFAAETRAVSVSLISEMQWGILPIMEISPTAGPRSIASRHDQLWGRVQPCSRRRGRRARIPASGRSRRRARAGRRGTGASGRRPRALGTECGRGRR